VLIDAEQPCMQHLHIGVKALEAKPRDYPNITFLYIDSLFLYIDELNLLALARYVKANIHQTFLSNNG
jgi:hypothetical protein